jgi:hypothetical protein
MGTIEQSLITGLNPRAILNAVTRYAF